MTNRNPQELQMADQSMIRTLSAQMRCIWPQERLLFTRYGTPKTILDVGCGTGECTVRLAQEYPDAKILGIELNPDHVKRAKEKCRDFGSRVEITQGDAFSLKIHPETIDLVVCRHLLQSIPNPEKVVEQCWKTLRFGGWLHLLLEDYTMIHLEGSEELDHFWLNGAVAFGLDTKCDLRIGRRGISLLHNFTERQQDFVVVDTERVSRDDFATVFSAWRDGYTDVLSPYLRRKPEEVLAIWNEMITIIQTGYALWQVPIVSGKKE